MVRRVGKTLTRRGDGGALCACRVLEMHLPACLAEEVLTSQQTGDTVRAGSALTVFDFPDQPESDGQQPPSRTVTL